MTIRLELLWIPLGADGSPLVRGCGRLYERMRAVLERRAPRALFHAALRLRTEAGTTYALSLIHI